VTAPDPLRRAFESILSGYARARARELFGKRSSMWGEFETIAKTLKDSPKIAAFSHVVIRWSAGQGRWATVPWIAALDDRETSRTSEGVYVIYLFRADMTGLYLTLNQGTQWVMAGYGEKGANQLRERAQLLRERSTALREHGFTVARGIDLRSDLPIVRGYEDSTVAYKVYERGAVPVDAALLADLERALAAYGKLVPSRRLFGLPGESASLLRDRLKRNSDGDDADE